MNPRDIALALIVAAFFSLGMLVYTAAIQRGTRFPNILETQPVLRK